MIRTLSVACLAAAGCLAAANAAAAAPTERAEICESLTQYATAVALAHQTGTPFAKVLPIAEDLRARFGTDHPIVVLKAAYALPRYDTRDMQQAIILAFRDESRSACLKRLR